MKSILDKIINKLSFVRKKYYEEKILFGIGVFIFSTGIGVFIFSLLETLFHFSSNFRTIFIFIFLFSQFAIFLNFVLTPFLRFKKILPSLNNEEVAVIIGENEPTIKDRLLNILQISSEKIQNEFVIESINQIYDVLKNVDLNGVIKFDKVKKFYKKILLSLSIFLLFFIFPQSGFSDAFFRLINFNVEFRKQIDFEFIISPGNKNFIKDENVDLKAILIPKNNSTFKIEKIKEIVLNFNESGIKTIEKIKIKSNNKNEFIYTIKNLKRSFNYSFSVNEIFSDEYSILVSNRPIVKKINVKIIPPEYTKKEIETLGENIGDVNALIGSKIYWELTVDENIKNAEIEFSNSKKLNLKKNDDKYFGTKTVSSNDEYQIKLTDNLNIKNSNPIKYKINSIQDEYPKIEVIAPNKNVDITSDMILKTDLNITDDFGFSKLNIVYRLIESKYEKPNEKFQIAVIPIEKNKSSQEIFYNWSLKNNGFVPEDIIEYYFEIFDNDGISGAKSTKSENFILRFPAFEEVISKAEDLNKKGFEELEKAKKEAMEIKKDVDELSREIKKNNLQIWEKERKIENIKEKYQSLKETLKSSKDKIQDLTDALQKNSLLSQETMEKYFELQKILNEFEKSDLLNALQKLQMGIKEFSSEEIKKAMEQVQVSDENIRSSIERSISLLKKIQIEQKMNELIERTEKILDEQNEIQNSKDDFETQTKKQNEIKTDFNSLQKEMNKLGEMINPENTSFPMEELQNAKNEIEKNQINENINESLKNLQNKNQQGARSSQKKAEKGMQKLSQQLSQMQQKMFSNEMEEISSALKKAMKDLLNLSLAQEKLKNSLQQNETNDQTLRNQSHEQLSLQSDLSKITTDLISLSQKSFVVNPAMGKAIGKSMNEMMQSIKALEDRNANAAKLNQASSMAALNESASQMSKALSSLSQQPGGGGSLIEQLKNLTSQQQSLNLKTEELNGEGLSEKEIAEFGKLAKEQEAIRKSLEQLNEEAENNPDKNRLLGEMNDLEEMMKEVENALNSGDENKNANLLQKKILSRMLEHQRSMQEKDYEEKRESVSGTLKTKKSPSEIKIDFEKKNKTIELLNAEKDGFSKDYQILIKKYFEELMKVEN